MTDVSAPPTFDPGWARSTAYPQVNARRERADGELHRLLNPGTDAQVGSWCEATAQELDDAVAARASFDDGRWRRMPRVRRTEVLGWVAPTIRERLAELIGRDCVSTGKVFLGGIGYDGHEAANAFAGAAAGVREGVGEVRDAGSPPGCSPETGHGS